MSCSKAKAWDLKKYLEGTIRGPYPDVAGVEPLARVLGLLGLGRELEVSLEDIRPAKAHFPPLHSLSRQLGIEFSLE